MRVLQICSKPPYPPVDGGAIGMLNFTRALFERKHQIKVIAATSYKHPVDKASLPDDFVQDTQIELVKVDLRIHAWDAFKNLFTKKSYHVERFISKEFERKIVQVLKTQTFDIIQLESIYVSPYISIIRKYSKAKIVLRAHNVEHLIWKKLAQHSAFLLKKKYLVYLAKKLKRYELCQLNRCDGIITFTQTDADYFLKHGCKKPLTVIPFGVVPRVLSKNVVVEYPSLFHIGAMDWMPNEEGMKWFLEEVWPMVHERFPDLIFYLAGRRMPEWLMQYEHPNVVVLGEVEDAFGFMDSKGIMIVPLLSGSGIRIKIIEGMDAAKPIITTGVGAEGIDYENGRNILIADTPEEFFNQIVFCVTHPAESEKIGLAAKELIAHKHNIDEIVQRLELFYNQLLNA